MELKVGQIWEACEGARQCEGDITVLSPEQLDWHQALTLQITKLNAGPFGGFESVVISNTFKCGQAEAGDIKHFPKGIEQYANWRLVESGVNCSVCCKFYVGSQPNRPDGSMVCWACEVENN